MYDNKDLLTLPEEEFNKLRGNRITMIFQDPMSSLDPIMKIGKQMTEATLLNVKTNRKYSAKAFKNKLKALKKSFADSGVADGDRLIEEFREKVLNERDALDLESAFMKEFAEKLVKALGDETSAQTYIHYMMDQAVMMNRHVTKEEHEGAGDKDHGGRRHQGA